MPEPGLRWAWISHYCQKKNTLERTTLQTKSTRHSFRSPKIIFMHAYHNNKNKETSPTPQSSGGYLLDQRSTLWVQKCRGERLSECITPNESLRLMQAPNSNFQFPYLTP